MMHFITLHPMNNIINITCTRHLAGLRHSPRSQLGHLAWHLEPRRTNIVSSAAILDGTWPVTELPFTGWVRLSLPSAAVAVAAVRSVCVKACCEKWDSNGFTAV